MKITAEYIKELVNHGEHSSVEMKKCKNSVPDSVWETYSAFANTRGGVMKTRRSLLPKDLRLPE